MKDKEKMLSDATEKPRNAYQLWVKGNKEFITEM
jgi:hypothetical protein